MSQSLFKFGWAHYERKIKRARDAYNADPDINQSIYTHKNWKLLQRWDKAIKSAWHFVDKRYDSKTADIYLGKEQNDCAFAYSVRKPALPVSYQPYWQRAY